MWGMDGYKQQSKICVSSEIENPLVNWDCTFCYDSGIDWAIAVCNFAMSIYTSVRILQIVECRYYTAQYCIMLYK